MFARKDNCYITKGIQEAVPYSLQLFCWKLIIKRVEEKEPPLDYLRIIEFEVNEETRLLTIVHRQEEPELKQIYFLHLLPEYHSLKATKLWIIDDGQTQTMLLPEEY